MTRLFVLAAALIAGLLAPPAASAAEEPRTIVVLADRGAASTPLRYAAPVLAHLGLTVEPHDAAQPLPDLSARGDVRGVLIWLDDGRVGDATGLTPWVRALGERGVPVALMGRMPEAEDRFGLFLALGLIQAPDERAYGYDLRIAERDEAIAGYERRFEPPFPPLDIVRPIAAAEAMPVLTLQRRDDAADRTMPLVVTAHGAYAADGYALWRSADGAHMRWLVDPVEWFRRAFKLGVVPTPDATTLNARRIFALSVAPADPAQRDAAAALAGDLAAARKERPIDLLNAGAPAGRPTIPAAASVCRDRVRALLLGNGGFVDGLAKREAPHRLEAYAPVALVCAAERDVALRAATDILGDATSRPLAAAALSLDEIAAGAASVRLEPAGTGIWRVHDRGALNTLRFDDAAHLRVDWERSVGVIGAGRVNAALYVALDPEATEVTVAVTNLPWTPPPFATLVESRWAVSGLVRDIETAEMSLQGYGPGEMVWSVEPHSDWELRFTPKNGRTLRYRAEAGADGLLAFSLPPLAADGAALTFERQDYAEVGP